MPMPLARSFAASWSAVFCLRSFRSGTRSRMHKFSFQPAQRLSADETSQTLSCCGEKNTAQTVDFYPRFGNYIYCKHIKKITSKFTKVNK